MYYGHLNPNIEGYFTIKQIGTFFVHYFNNSLNSVKINLISTYLAVHIKIYIYYIILLGIL